MTGTPVTFAWDAHHEFASLTLPFASPREGRWAKIALGGDTETSDVSIAIGEKGRALFVTIERAAPDSYSDEWEQMRADSDAWTAETEARVKAASKNVADAIMELGLVPSDDTVRPPDVEQRIALVRRDAFRRMPPTPRRVREAIKVGPPDDRGTYVTASRQVIDASTVFCDHRTGEPVARTPLVVDESYWMTGTGPSIATVDVAVVDDATLASFAEAASDVRGSVDLRAFLARELQYGPLDLAGARSQLLRTWLEQHDALSTEAGSVAVENSITTIVRRRAMAGEAIDRARFRPWSNDPRILVVERE